MFPDIPFYLSVPFILGGLLCLGWSADRFIDGAAELSRRCGISPFVVGMVIIGFGTSAPELFVSALSGIGGHSDLSLGNAFGSCIFNIAFILGVAALIRPFHVTRSVAYVAVPILAAIALFAGWLARDGFTRTDGALLLAAFLAVMPIYCWYDQRTKGAGETETDTAAEPMTLARAWACLVGGLALLATSSHLLVWGCVDVARALGVSELLIGLTVVAVGTSLPELASAVAAARKGESDLVVGNIVGSNIFNTLAVVGIAGTISPFKAISPYLFTRDLPLLVALSLSVWFFSVDGRLTRAPGTVGRRQGLVWILAFVVYAGVMLWQELQGK